MTTTYKWHEAYKAALLETDWSQMDQRIRGAEASIQDRKNELALDHGGTRGEVHAMEEAMRSLKVLKAEAASWSNNRENVSS
jgi:hypothetical protein